MQIDYRQGIGVFLAAATLVMMIPAASARAGRLIVPTAPQAHQVEPHPVGSGSAPSAAPAPAPAPAAAPSSSDPAPAAAPSPTHSQSSGGMAGFDSEPGDGVPPGVHEPDRPLGPEPGDPDCENACLNDWHNYLSQRWITVFSAAHRETDPERAATLREDAKILRQEDVGVMEQIYEAGGTPDGVTDEMPDAARGGSVQPGTSQPSADPSPGSSQSSGTPLSGNPAGAVTVDAISGVGELVTDDLGTWDLSPAIDAAALVTLSWVPEAFQNILNGTSACPKKGVDDKVPVCAK